MHLVVIWSLQLIATALAFPSGAPNEACSTMTPNHRGSPGPQPGNGGFAVLHNICQGYRQYRRYKVMLAGVKEFRGFFCRSLNQKRPHLSTGSFPIWFLPKKTRESNCEFTSFGFTSNVKGVTHSQRLEGVSNITFQWTAPRSGSGPVFFKCTVVMDFNTYWTDIVSKPVNEMKGFSQVSCPDPTPFPRWPTRSDSCPRTCPRGPLGKRGDKGEGGPPGPPGAQGPPGRKGSRGYQGLRGESPLTNPFQAENNILRGRSGSKGSRGDRGPPGLKGKRGDIGLTGFQGPLGPTGLIGPSGPNGTDGLKGFKGERGDSGGGSVPQHIPQRILRGDPGEPGPPGPKGLLDPNLLELSQISERSASINKVHQEQRRLERTESSLKALQLKQESLKEERDILKKHVDQLWSLRREQCNCSLGMEDGRIADSQITANSERSHRSRTSARLNNDSAWVPIRNRNAWIQVDLQREADLVGIATQGLQLSRSSAWVKEFTLSYKTTTDQAWTDLTVCKGNTDPTTIVHCKLTDHRPIKAQYVRIKPVSWETRVSLRMELYGC